MDGSHFVRARSLAKSSIVLAVCATLLLACDAYPTRSKNDELSDMQDRQQQLTRQDYRDMNKVKKLLSDEEKRREDMELGAAPIPDLAQVLAAPRPPKIANTRLVTLAVTDDVPLRDVLFELGRLANVDIEVGRGLDTEGVNLRATDRPFNEVIERISDLGGLRYSVHGNSIRIERDLPYIKNYNLDFINMIRSSTSSYDLSTSILSGGGSGEGGTGGGTSSGGTSGGSSGSGSGNVGSVGNSGSSSSITAQMESDLWASLEASVTEILNYLPSGNGSTGAATEGAAPGAGAGAVGGSSSGFVINRQGGILSVNATERQHDMIQRFLTVLSRNTSAQVLIEAKIVEVSLTEQFLSGVDWNKLIGNLNGAYWNPGSFNPSGTIGTTGATVFGVDELGLDIAVTMAEQFGTTRTLSSPRLNATNNQQAVLTFAQNEVFFECTQDQGQVVSNSGGSSTTLPPTTNCTANAVPIGIILNILPSINLDTQEIILSVRPTLTRKVRDAISPQTIVINNVSRNVTAPVIEVREIDSIMKVKSGGVMIIGGLMEDTSGTTQAGVPGLSEIPVLGSVFKSRDETYGKRELIIFIKATIVNPDGSAHKVDRKLMDRFTTDPRPLFPKKEDAE